jgi:hypothetical protein
VGGLKDKEVEDVEDIEDENCAVSESEEVCLSIPLHALYTFLVFTPRSPLLSNLRLQLPLPLFNTLEW